MISATSSRFLPKVISVWGPKRDVGDQSTAVSQQQATRHSHTCLQLWYPFCKRTNTHHIPYHMPTTHTRTQTFQQHGAFLHFSHTLTQTH